MSKPKIADRKPIKVELKKGEEQYWCACGLSKNQPYCDGSHRTTDITPVKFEAEETGDAYLCMCKHSKNAPYCDGSHAKLKEESDAPESPAPASSESTKEEPTLAYIKALAKDGLSKTGHHGEMGAMGVPIPELPKWKDIQLLAAQMATKPLMEDIVVGSELIIGPNAKKPLKLDIPLFVSDMSFGALSEEAKVSLAKGAEMAGTGICSGEGGMLDDEQQANGKYFYEYASAKFGFEWEKLKRVQAFHFKGG
jgi:CDGSH-type Zn-finger protein